MIWPFWQYLALFWMLKKIVYFEACFGEIWAKLAIYYQIHTLNLVILTNFQWKFGLYLAFFIFENLAILNCLWPNLAFLIILDLTTLISGLDVNELGWLSDDRRFVSHSCQYTSKSCQVYCICRRQYRKFKITGNAGCFWYCLGKIGKT